MPLDEEEALLENIVIEDLSKINILNILNKDSPGSCVMRAVHRPSKLILTLKEIQVDSVMREELMVKLRTL